MVNNKLGTIITIKNRNTIYIEKTIIKDPKIMYEIDGYNLDDSSFEFIFIK